MTHKNIFKTLLLTSIGLLTLGFSASVSAQTDTVLPKLPEPIQNLANEGAQIRFLGKDQDVEGWIAIKNGQEQYFYVLPNNGGFVSGLLYDQKGKAVTLEQVNRLREQSGDLLDVLATDNTTTSAASDVQSEKYEFKTPAEQLFWDIENSNWIPVGQAGTPVIYSFVEPQCPHCHAMMKDLKPRIEDGKVQMRLIPVGWTDETRAQAAFLLATPAPDKAWWRHLDGDETALPAKQEINQQGVERNLAIMQSWKLDVTPLIVYRGNDGKVKIIRGEPKDINALINDIGARD